MKIILFTIAMMAISQTEAATFYFVRHAEKVTSDPNDRDPALTQQGQQRAENLAWLLTHANIQAIYSTDYKRTRQTAEPLAKARGLTVQSYDPKQIKSWLDSLKTTQDNAVIVGHSNTTPQAVSYLTKTPVKSLTEKDYGDVYQVIIDGESVKMTQFKIPPIPSQSPQ